MPNNADQNSGIDPNVDQCHDFDRSSMTAFLTHMGMVLGISAKYTISQSFRKCLFLNLWA